ncbi:branched-chain amino acid transport system substrate-binding protein [Modestobacter sp. DSM 44400]|uniref:ABC transporter substrate-binding protein n=1 Tax=Modestobacter sp. DSM 44400 TaxID=1550230 RepID=UPI00089CD4B1|nr:ABC transporter substrate-binding protein [Modestobacter sp. DSM 44400]SDX99545.1 branched-chain amino acid transport system substrate-binding protein [Modestobacter sp. DSM 44400]
MDFPDLSRRSFLGVLGAGAGTLALSACGGGSLGGGSGAGSSGGGAVKVGLVIPQAGVYTPLGVDMQNGWQLWLDQNGGKMGDYTVTTVTADEGEGPDTGVPAIQGLLQNEQVDVVVGIVNSATALGAAAQFAEAKKLLLISNAGAVAITGAARTPYVWRASFTNAQNSAAMGEHLAKEGVGPVYIMAPDYAAGQENVVAFTKAYEGGGGTLAGQALTPFGTTQDYQPFLSGVQESGAKAVFCFYSGGEAVTFVKQYDQFGLKATTPLYGSGFLTEGSVLKGQGASAVGVQTALHYSTEIDNEANTAFVAAYQKAYDALPTCFAMATFDAANVLNRALAEAGDVTGDALSGALDGLGVIDDSPRGPWTFSGQNPKQTVYLREVTMQGSSPINAVVSELGVYDQP